jgi:hypothetical protein
MNITCPVIEDLLPLYAENLLSDDSRRLVEEHLSACPDCRARLSALQTAAPPAVPSARQALQGMRHYLLRQRLLAAGAALAVVLALALAVLSFLTAPIYFPYTSELFSVEPQGDGTLTLRFAPDVCHTEMYSSTDAETGREEVSLWAWTTRLDQWQNKQGAQVITVAPSAGREMNLWYCFEGADDYLVWGQTRDEGRITLPRLALTYYLLLALAAGVLGAALFFLHELKWPRRILTLLLPLPLSYAAAQILVKGLDFTTHAILRDLRYILWITLPLYLGTLAVLWLIRRRRQARQA